MTGNDKKNNFGIIEELIDAEEKAALAKFRSGRFLERLEERIESAAPPAVRPDLFRGVPRAVWVSAATLAIVGGALFMLRLLRTPAPGGSAVVESYLRRLPGIQAIETRPRAFSETPLPMSSLDKAITAVLFRPAAQAGGAPRAGGDKGFSAIDPRTRPMGLDELYDILIGNRSVERVLTGISQKTKEG